MRTYIHNLKQDHRRASGILLLLLIPCLSWAQAPLTFEEALARTLENNFDLQIERIDTEIAENNASRSANGYLPSLTGSGGYNWTYYTGTNQIRTGDQVFDPNNSYNYSAGLTLSYALFDGFGRKYRYEQAMGSAQLSEVQLQRLMENTVLQLSQVYHEVARLEQQCNSLDSTLRVSQDRLLRVNYGLEYGQSTPLDALNAAVDLDTDSISLLNSRQELANTKRSLNLLMGAEIDAPLQVQENVKLREDLHAEMVLEAAMQKNSQVLSAAQSEELAKLAVQINKAVWYPSIAATGGYQYRGSDDPNGAFLIGSSSYGPTAGVSLSWNIYDFRNKTQLQNARLNMEQALIASNQAEQQVIRDALNAFGNYENALFVLRARESALRTAQANFARSEESFALAQIGSVDFRQAQLNLLNAELLLSQAIYEAKNTELQVLALMGELVEGS